VHGEATTIDPAAQQVQTAQGVLGFDYLVIATGYRNDWVQRFWGWLIEWWGSIGPAPEGTAT